MTFHSPGLRYLAARTAIVAVTTGTAGHAAAAEADAASVTHIRTSSPAIAELIHDATARSPAFRQMVDTIEATDGIVYVVEEQVSTRHALLLFIEPGGLRSQPSPAGPRLTRTSKADWDVQGSIGHELQHAIEVLSNPAVRSNAAMFLFNALKGSDRINVQETETASQTQQEVTHGI